jgi:hypothetical protein
VCTLCRSPTPSAGDALGKNAHMLRLMRVFSAEMRDALLHGAGSLSASLSLSVAFCLSLLLSDTVAGCFVMKKGVRAGAVSHWSGLVWWIEPARKVTRLPGATYDNIVIVIAGAFAYFRNPIRQRSERSRELTHLSRLTGRASDALPLPLVIKRE